jgi:hypothetical protein
VIGEQRLQEREIAATQMLDTVGERVALSHVDRHRHPTRLATLATTSLLPTERHHASDTDAAHFAAGAAGTA